MQFYLRRREAILLEFGSVHAEFHSHRSQSVWTGGRLFWTVFDLTYIVKIVVPHLPYMPSTFDVCPFRSYPPPHLTVTVNVQRIMAEIIR